MTDDAAYPSNDDLPVRPNTFQQLMLQWERLAPYNAAQFALLNADIDATHARLTWRDLVLTLGLQQIGQHPDAPPLEPAADVEGFITAELNRPFARGDSPLRPFILRDGTATQLGIVYRHVVADSASIRFLMQQWLERILLRSPTTQGHIALMNEPAFRLRDPRRPWSLLREIGSEFSRMSRVKRVRRLPASSEESTRVGWRQHALPRGLLACIVRHAKQKRVRVNDVFVTAAAFACDRLMPHEDADARRDLGIGTIADVRPADRPPADHFGLSLGFLQTFWRWQDLQHWDRALSVAAAQSKLARTRGLAFASVLRLSAALRVGRSMERDPAKLATFYRKRCPLAAGISNVTLNREWPGALHPSPLRSYARVSPLGPMLPLVFSPTTLGETLHLGVTWRTDLLNDARARELVDAFIAQLVAACR